jgi:hypothetical protein
VGGGRGGRVAAVTFVCKTSWKNSIVFSKALTFRNIIFAEYKKENNLIQTPVYTFVIPYLFYTFILLRLPCIEKTQISKKLF